MGSKLESSGEFRDSSDALVRYMAGIVLTCLVFSTGCAPLKTWWHNGFKVGPDYAKPATKVAETWIDFNDPRVISTSHGVDEGAWWQTFGDPTMDELVFQAYASNLPLRIAGMRVLESQSQRAIAAGNLFPQFQQAFGNYQRTQLSQNGNPFGDAVDLPARAFSLWTHGFTASWELDVWGRLRRLIESADANVDVSIEIYDDVLLSLIAETASAYVDVRAFQGRIRLAEANVKTQERSLGLAESRYRNGVVSKLDVTQALSNLEQTRALIPVLKKGMRQANNRLCVLLGTPPRDLTLEFGDGPIPSAAKEVAVGMPADLVRRRPDIRRAEREVASQSALIGVAIADLFPSFTIDGSINWQANQFKDVFESASNAGMLAPAFNWNILNYGRIINHVAVQDARFQQLALNYQQTVIEAGADVENSIVEFLRSQEQAATLERGVAATVESVQIVTRQYQEGKIDFDRVNNLQRDLVVQQDALAVAQADVALGLIGIYRAMGGGWQIRLDQYTPLNGEEEIAEAQPLPLGIEPPLPALNGEPVILNRPVEENAAL